MIADPTIAPVPSAKERTIRIIISITMTSMSRMQIPWIHRLSQFLVAAVDCFYTVLFSDLKHSLRTHSMIVFLFLFYIK